MARLCGGDCDGGLLRERACRAPLLTRGRLALGHLLLPRLQRRRLGLQLLARLVPGGAPRREVTVAGGGDRDQIVEGAHILTIIGRGGTGQARGETRARDDRRAKPPGMNGIRPPVRGVIGHPGEVAAQEYSRW